MLPVSQTTLRVLLGLAIVMSLAVDALASAPRPPAAEGTPSIGALTRALVGSDTAVRDRVGPLLARIGERRARAVLTEMLTGVAAARARREAESTRAAKGADAAAVATPSGLRADRDTGPPPVGAARPNALAQRRDALETLVASDAAEAAEAVRAITHGEDEALALIAVDALAADRRDGIARLRSFIPSMPPERTTYAVTAAARAQGQGAVEYLLAALVAGRWQPWHRGAKRALAALGEPGVAAAVDWLHSHPQDVRAVEGLLSENVAAAAAAAGRVLGKLGRSRRHTDVKLVLLQVIRDASAAGQLPAVLAAYRDRRMEHRVRVAAFETLSVVGGGSYQEPIVAALGDADPSIRSLAYEAASRLGLDQALPIVAAELERVRPESWTPGAVTALGDLGGARAIAFLRANYHQTSPETRAAILRVASRFSSPEAVALLTDAVGSAHRGTSLVARALLAERR